MKKCAAGLICVILFVIANTGILWASSPGPDRINILVNGEEIDFAYKPFATTTEVMVHIRFVAYFFGAEIYWEQMQRVAIITNGNITISVEPNSNEIHWLCAFSEQSKIFEMSAPARIYNERLFAPATEIINALDYTINAVSDFIITINDLVFLTPQEKSAFYEYGLLHEEGRRGTPIDFELAAYWYRRAAEAGHAEAENNLGVLYRHGRGVPQDDEAALFWFRRAAARGQVLAIHNVGIMYYHGDGTEKDYVQAAYWLTIAAEQGLSHAQAAMGYFYLYGIGVTQSYERYLYWLRLAAAQGLNNAEHNLGSVYFEGRAGAEQNYETAMYWYRRAAVQGNSNSQDALAVGYKYGIGLAQSDAWAEFWFTLADGGIPERVTEHPEISDYGRQAAERFLRAYFLHASSDFKLFELTGNGIPEILMQRGDRWLLFVYYNGVYRDWGLLFGEPRFYCEFGMVLSMSIGNTRGFYELVYSHLELTCESGRVTPLSHRFFTTQTAIEHHFTEAFAVNPTRYGSNIPIIPIPQLTELRYEMIENANQEFKNNGTP
ncbi:MAG: stalk domain-containing protein [Defluviitaleaceae bacterium]|nr:stalk domain-containing protein [Defluviitaleaceae bacterium]